MDRLTSIKIKNQSGVYGDQTPISALVQNIEYDNNHNLLEVLGSIKTDGSGNIQNIQSQLDFLYNNKASGNQVSGLIDLIENKVDKNRVDSLQNQINTKADKNIVDSLQDQVSIKVSYDELNNYVDSQIPSHVTGWLDSHVNPVGSAVAVDDSLTIQGAAADAKKVGDEISNLKDDLHSYNSYDMLRQFGTFTSRTSGGITYTWNDEYTVCTAAGTTTGLSIDNLYSDSGMPKGIEAGKTYRVMCNTTDINLMLEIISYVGSTSLGSTFITEDSDYTVPESATNLRIRLRTRHTSGSPSTVNATISIQILNALTNSELAERTELNKSKNDYAINTIETYNVFDMLQEFGTYVNKTSGGVTYTWNADKTICTAVGTTTELSINNMYAGSGMPSGVIAGEKYFIKCKTTDTNLMLEIIAFNGDTIIDDLSITNDMVYTVPLEATELRIRIRTRYVSELSTTVNATISVQFLNALSNAELSTQVIENTENITENTENIDYTLKAVEGFNAYDMLRKFGTYNDITSGGVEYTWNADKTVCTAVGTTTGVSIDNIYSGNTLPTEVVAGEKYFIKCKTTDTNLMLEIIAYNGSTTIKDDYITEDMVYMVPYEATTIRIRLRTRYTSTAPSTVNATISVQFLNASTNRRLMEDINRPQMGYMQIFPKYTTIGDSLMGGYMHRNGVTINTATAKEAGNNWVNYLALRIGRTFTNLAVGGSTTGDWRSSHISTANIDTDCYIVGLGVNDHRQTVSIGTASDIATDFTNNANSFYGNYDYILRQLMAWKPNAHIFCFTIPKIEGGTSADYNVAIRAITALYPAKVHLIDLAIDYADYYDNPIVYTNYTGGHFNPIAYSYFSQVIEKAINTFMQNNDAVFATAPYA